MIVIVLAMDTSIILRLVITGPTLRQTLASENNKAELAVDAFQGIVIVTAPLRLVESAQTFSCVYTSALANQNLVNNSQTVSTREGSDPYKDCCL